MGNFERLIIYEKFKKFNWFLNFCEIEYGTFDVRILSKLVAIKKQTKVYSVLPKPDGSLSQVMPMSSVDVANVAIQQFLFPS